MMKLIPRFKTLDLNPTNPYHDEKIIIADLFQKGGKVKGYKVSSGIMSLAQKFADKEAAKQNEEEGNGAPQSTFLMNRKN